MTPDAIPDMAHTTAAAMDVFAAARWFDSLWNSSAKAVSDGEIEWQCDTWGSGCGRGAWEETATFALAATRIGLRTWRNRAGRDELVLAVPLHQVPEIARLIGRLGEEVARWPWLESEDRDGQLVAAAEVLDMPPAALRDNRELMAALRME